MGERQHEAGTKTTRSARQPMTRTITALYQNPRLSKQSDTNVIRKSVFFILVDNPQIRTIYVRVGNPQISSK